MSNILTGKSKITTNRSTSTATPKVRVCFRQLTCAAPPSIRWMI